MLLSFCEAGRRQVLNLGASDRLSSLDVLLTVGSGDGVMQQQGSSLQRGLPQTQGALPLAPASLPAAALLAHCHLMPPQPIVHFDSNFASFLEFFMSPPVYVPTSPCSCCCVLIIS